LGHWKKHYSHSGAKPYLKGQAILELAIFGSILIMLLGILINYGLRYNYQQQVMQQAFRKALASAAVSMNDHTSISVAHAVVEDKHIPNPADPFAVGSVLPSSSGASVTRNYKLMETPDYEDELPSAVINVQGKSVSFKSAGFRGEVIDEESLPRYQEIYGSINVWKVGDVTPGRISVKIIDSCAGEIMNYDTTVRQCRQIVDAEACIKECKRGGGKDCANTCSKPMNVPWYCGTVTGTNPDTDYVEIDNKNHRYYFSALEQIFAFAPKGKKNMGLQEGYTQRTSIENRLDKKETTADITTTDSFDWQTQTERSIVHKAYGDTSTNTNTTNIVTSAPANKTRTQNWLTKW